MQRTVHASICCTGTGRARSLFKLAHFVRPNEPHGEYHKLLFGATDDSGCIVFHDAWLIPDSESEPLKLDVMTPHHPKWLDGSVAPTDFDSPNPVPFLSVAGKFRVALTWWGPEHAEAKRWVELANSLLKEALAEWGVAGKTTSGYGRLVEDWGSSRQDIAHAASTQSTTGRAPALPEKRPCGTPTTVRIVGKRNNGFC